MVSIGNLCQCITKDGMNCKMRVKPGQRYCHHHKNCDEIKLKVATPAKRAGAGALPMPKSPRKSPVKELERQFEDLQIEEYEPGSNRSRRNSYDDFEPGSVRSRSSPNNGRRMSPRMSISNEGKRSPVEQKMNPLLSSLLGLDAGYRPLVSLIQSFANGYYKATFRFRNGTTKTILLKLDPLIPEYNFIPNIQNPEMDFILRTKLPGVFSPYFSFVLTSLEEIDPREFYQTEGISKTEITIKDIAFPFREVYQQVPEREDNRPGGEYVKIKPREMKLLEDAEDAIERKDYVKFKKLYPRLRLRHLNKLYNKVSPDDMKMVKILFGFNVIENESMPIILNIKTGEFNNYVFNILEQAVLKDDYMTVNLIIPHLAEYPINIILLEHLLELSKSSRYKLSEHSLQTLMNKIKVKNNL